MRARILIAMAFGRHIVKNRGLRRPHGRSSKKISKKAKKKLANMIEVLDENGQVVYRGPEKRSYHEQVFFDSANNSRRFMRAGKISKRRLKELKKIGKAEVFFGVRTYPSQRSSKRKIKTV